MLGAQAEAPKRHSNSNIFYREQPPSDGIKNSAVEVTQSSPKNLQFEGYIWVATALPGA